MTRYTVFGKATKCPNCHAYLTGHGELVTCEYCGVTVSVELPPVPQQAPPVGPVPPPAPPAARAADPTELVRPVPARARMWPYFLMAPIMTGAILAYTYFAQRQAMERSDAISERARAHATEIQNEAQARARASVKAADERPGASAGGAGADPVCHLSAPALDEVVSTQSRVVAACFDEAPKSVKTVEATAVLEILPTGMVKDVDLEWEGWKPSAWARKCATRKIRSWKLAKPSGGLPTRCEVHLSLEPP